jgi:16S rRNA processing protein RimM
VAPEGGGDQEVPLVVARVRRSHGVRGEILISVDTDRPRPVFRPGRTLLLGDGRGEPTGAEVVLESIRSTSGGALLKLSGIDDRNASDRLHGATLLIPANEAEPAAPDEVHYRDLVGMEAVADGQSIGRVVDILVIGAGETLVVRGAAGREILVPFVKEIVREVDLAGRRLGLELPAGFLEI